AGDRAVDPARAGAGRGGERDGPADLGEGHGEQDEVEPPEAEPKAEVPDHRAQSGRRGRADEHAEPGGDPPAQEEHRRHVGADPDEGGVPHGELTGVAPEDVPGLPEVGVEEDQGEERDRVGAEERRQREEQADGEGPEPAHHAAARPNRPAGRKSRITIRRENETRSLRDGESSTAPSDSAMATRRPPRKAPAR